LTNSGVDPLGRALSAWFRFVLFGEWIDRTLNERLGRLWGPPIDGIGIPPTYTQLDAD
jgi:hypothetical protein